MDTFQGNSGFFKKKDIRLFYLYTKRSFKRPRSAKIKPLV